MEALFCAWLKCVCAAYAHKYHEKLVNMQIPRIFRSMDRVNGPGTNGAKTMNSTPNLYVDIKYTDHTYTATVLDQGQLTGYLENDDKTVISITPNEQTPNLPGWLLEEMKVTNDPVFDSAPEVEKIDKPDFCSVGWNFFDENSRPINFSKSHIMEYDCDEVTLCGVSLPSFKETGADIEPQGGDGYCKRCQSIAAKRK